MNQPTRKRYRGHWSNHWGFFAPCCFHLHQSKWLTSASRSLLLTLRWLGAIIMHILYVTDWNNVLPNTRGPCCGHRKGPVSKNLFFNQTCLPRSATLKGAVPDVLSHPIHPPQKCCHQTHPNRMMWLLSPPHHSPIAKLLTVTSSLFRLLFAVKWSPTQSHSSVGLLCISLSCFFIRLFLSGWELIWEVQLLVDCPQRTPGHSKIQQIYSKYCYFLALIYVCERWDFLFVHSNNNVKCEKLDAHLRMID